MTTTHQTFLFFGSLFAFAAVAAGAFGAHSLKSKLPIESLNTFEVAVRYQMYHALALLILTSLYAFFPSIWFVGAGWLFIIGIVVFSGSLYTLVFSGIKMWGAITPIGGVLLLAGWLSLLLGSILSK